MKINTQSNKNYSITKLSTPTKSTAFCGNVSVKISQNAQKEFSEIIQDISNKFYAGSNPAAKKALDEVRANFEKFKNALSELAENVQSPAKSSDSSDKLGSFIKSLKAFDGDVDIKLEGLKGDIIGSQRSTEELQNVISKIPSNGKNADYIFLSVNARKNAGKEELKEVFPVFGTYTSVKDGFKIVDNINSMWQKLFAFLPKKRF